MGMHNHRITGALAAPAILIAAPSSYSAENDLTDIKAEGRGAA